MVASTLLYSQNSPPNKAEIEQTDLTVVLYNMYTRGICTAALCLHLTYTVVIDSSQEAQRTGLRDTVRGLEVVFADI